MDQSLEKVVWTGLYHGRSKKYSGQRIIVKAESNETEAPQLAHEYRMYKALESDKTTGFPKGYYYGANGTFNMLVMVV